MLESLYAKHSDGRVCVAAAGENQLTQRAATQQDRAPTCQQHAEEIPNVAGMGDRLRGKAELEVMHGKVADQNSDKDGDETPQQVHILEHHRVAQTADHAHTRFLRQCAND